MLLPRGETPPRIERLAGELRIGDPSFRQLSMLGGLAFSSDGRSLVAAGSELHRWNVDTAALLPPSDASWGHNLDSVSGDGTVALQHEGALVQLRALDTAAVLARWTIAHATAFWVDQTGHHAAVAIHPRGLAFFGRTPTPIWRSDIETRVAAFSRDGARLAVAEGDRVAILDTATGRRVRDIEPKSSDQEITSLAFSPRGDVLACGTSSGVTILDVSAGDKQKEAALPPGHRAVCSLAFSADAARLAVGTCDRFVHLLDASSLLPLWSFRKHSTRVTVVAFSPDGSGLAAWGGEVVLMNAKTGQNIHPRSAHVGGVSSVAFVDAGSRVVSGGEDGTLRLWDARRGELVRVVDVGSTIRRVAASANAALVLAGPQDAVLRQWNGPTELARRASKTGIVFLDISADGSRAASVDESGALSVWAPLSAPTPAWTTELRASGAIALSADGRTLVVAVAGRLQIWDVATRKLRFEVPHAAGVRGVAVGARGERLVVSSEGFLEIWSLLPPTPQLLHRIDAAKTVPAQLNTDVVDIGSIRASADTEWIAGLANGTPIVWAAATGDVRWRAPVQAADIALTADGAKAATAHWDGTVRIWTLPGGAP